MKKKKNERDIYIFSAFFDILDFFILIRLINFKNLK